MLHAYHGLYSKDSCEYDEHGHSNDQADKDGCGNNLTMGPGRESDKEGRVRCRDTAIKESEHMPILLSSRLRLQKLNEREADKRTCNVLE